MTAPPCPPDAIPAGRPAFIADQPTTARYFPSLSPDTVWRFDSGAGALLAFGEHPLRNTSRAAYRVIETGSFGHVIVAERRSSDVLVALKKWHLCDDGRDFGTRLVVQARSVSPETWNQLDTCMDRAFWSEAPTEPARGKIIESDIWVVQCGPVRHELGCAIAWGGETFVEGVRAGRHHIVIRSIHSSRRPALADCVSLMETAIP